MVTDLDQEIPEKYRWDNEPVDLAVIVVNTPSGDTSDGFDYKDLTAAVTEFLEVSEAVLVRSTVGLGFLETDLYRKHQDKLSFSPEFYGATKWSSREVLDLGFTIFCENTPEWFVEMFPGKILRASAKETILAKLTENAFLATKVTFFHELYLSCIENGASFDVVRKLVTSDPRINPRHSFVEKLGWDSHCFNKDVPAFSKTSEHTRLVQAAVDVNRQHLLPLRKTHSDI